jgi:hypothetical protein
MGRMRPWVMIALVGMLMAAETEVPTKLRTLSGGLLGSDSLSVGQGKFEMPKRWEYPGGDTKPMQIDFESNGRLVFREGFEYLNPASWGYDERTQELVLIIPRLSGSQFGAIDWMIKRQSISKFDRRKKTLHYKFGPNTDSFDFLGWIFFRK